MKYKVIYQFECNPYEIIKDFMLDDGIDISMGDSDDKERPTTEVTLITFDNKPDAIKFMEYYSQHCCHTMLKANQRSEDLNKDVESWLTIQDYHLYECLYLKEVEEQVFWSELPEEIKSKF